MKAGIIPGTNCVVYQYDDKSDKYIRRIKTVPKLVEFDTNEVLYTPQAVITYNEYTSNQISDLEFLEMLGIPEEIDKNEIINNILIDIGGLLVIISSFGYLLLVHPSAVKDIS